jgi:hypothetical protein
LDDGRNGNILHLVRIIDAWIRRRYDAMHNAPWFPRFNLCGAKEGNRGRLTCGREMHEGCINTNKKARLAQYRNELRKR